MYYEKYMKYKMKYLQLVLQNGGLIRGHIVKVLIPEKIIKKNINDIDYNKYLCICEELKNKNLMDIEFIVKDANGDYITILNIEHQLQFILYHKVLEFIGPSIIKKQNKKRGSIQLTDIVHKKEIKKKLSIHEQQLYNIDKYKIIYIKYTFIKNFIDQYIECLEKDFIIEQAILNMQLLEKILNKINNLYEYTIKNKKIKIKINEKINLIFKNFNIDMIYTEINNFLIEIKEIMRQRLYSDESEDEESDDEGDDEGDESWGEEESEEETTIRNSPLFAKK